MSQIFSALPTDVHRLPTGYQVPKRGCREPPGCRCSEPRLPPSGQGRQRGRGVWHLGEVPAAKSGGRGERRHGLVVRGPAGEGGPGNGAAPQGQQREAAAPRVRPGRGGRVRPRSGARTVAVAAARRTRSSRLLHPAPAHRSLLAPVQAGASWTATAAARGAGGQQRDGTPTREQGKEGT